MFTGWSDWSTFSTCSKSCGIGVTVRYRNCSSAVKDACLGKSYELTTCSPGTCTG